MDVIAEIHENDIMRKFELDGLLYSSFHMQLKPFKDVNGNETSEKVLVITMDDCNP